MVKVDYQFVLFHYCALLLLLSLISQNNDGDCITLTSLFAGGGVLGIDLDKNPRSDSLGFFFNVS